MKQKKYKAFTLAELLILMSVLAVLMAAFAPIYTSRYRSAAIDSVWSYAPGEQQNGRNIYSDAPNKMLLQQSYIGVTPTADDIKALPYSKLVIRSEGKHPQIELQHGGSLVGKLFALNNNILLGGEYDSLSLDAATGNTAFGYNALNSLSNGVRNAAFGYNALSGVSTGNDNTVIGTRAGIGINSAQQGNTIIGNEGVPNGNNHNIRGNGNVLIGHLDLLGSANNPDSVDTAFSVAIGNKTQVWGDRLNGYKDVNGPSSNIGHGNVAIGYGAIANGNYNTAIGYGARTATGYYNTSIGYNACNYLLAGYHGSHITCVGVNKKLPDAVKNIPGLAQILNDNALNSKEYDKGLRDNNPGPAFSHVFIGNPVNTTNTSNSVIYSGNSDATDPPKILGPAALEAHSIPRLEESDNTSLAVYSMAWKQAPTGRIGKSMVIVNGDLVVRGQSYMLSHSPAHLYTDWPVVQDSIMGFTVYKDYNGPSAYSFYNNGYYVPGPDGVTNYNDRNDNFYPWAPISGWTRNRRLFSPADNGTQRPQHQKYTGHEPCICVPVWSGENGQSNLFKTENIDRDVKDENYDKTTDFPAEYYKLSNGNHGGGIKYGFHKSIYGDKRANTDGYTYQKEKSSSFSGVWFNPNATPNAIYVPSYLERAYKLGFGRNYDMNSVNGSVPAILENDDITGNNYIYGITSHSYVWDEKNSYMYWQEKYTAGLLKYDYQYGFHWPYDYIYYGGKHGDYNYVNGSRDEMKPNNIHNTARDVILDRAKGQYTDETYRMPGEVDADKDSPFTMPYSCCPVLTPEGYERPIYNDPVNNMWIWNGNIEHPVSMSDARLKNIGSPYTKGLEELSKINIYNYSYKSDNKPHTGVIAQDLKSVFPDAVTKDENGYYKIRWDEMFYASINAVKELYSKVKGLSDKVANDAKRLKILKSDNKKLESRLNELTKEIEKLEQK